MNLYLGWWPCIGLAVPFIGALMFFVYFYAIHFPFVVMRRPKEAARETTKRWEMWMIFYDSAGSSNVSVSQYALVNNVLSIVNLALGFSLQQALPLMIIGGSVGFVAENLYRLF